MSVQLSDGAGGFLASDAFLSPAAGVLFVGNGTSSYAQLILYGLDGNYVNIRPKIDTETWTLLLPGNSGVSGAFLTTDGTGQCTWQTDAPYSAGAPINWNTPYPPPTVGSAIDRLAACLATAYASAGLVQNLP
jgi:hypothetical protein